MKEKSIRTLILLFLLTACCVLMLLINLFILLFRFRFQGSVWVAAGLAFSSLVSIVNFFIIFRYLLPLKNLKDMLNKENMEAQDFPKTNITEINQLIRRIQEKQVELSEERSVITEAINMTDAPVGIFIMDYDDRSVYLSDMIFTILGIEKIFGSNYYDLDVWNELYCNLMDNRELFTDNIYIYSRHNREEKKWLKVRYRIKENKNVGVIIDLTEDYLEKRKLEYERDIDKMTKLLTRTAFLNKSMEALSASADRFAIVLVAELESLRSINDTYAHEVGDTYVKAAASLFYRFSRQNAFAARISDTQFGALIYNYADKAELLAIFNEFIKDVGESYIIMPDGFRQKVVLKIGYTWYPTDADNIEVLLRYADYAMYETRSASQDSAANQFDKSTFIKDSKLVRKNQILDKLLEYNMFDYAFQPIVDVRSGEIYGYEALMRSKLKELKSPMEITNLAKIQGRLGDIEHLTLFNLAQWYKDNKEAMGSRKLFINSMPKHAISENNMEVLRQNYGMYMGNIVYELMEVEHLENDVLTKKVDMARRLRAEIAIDDYGSGYGDDAILMTVNPSYVKVSMSIIKGIAYDEKKMTVLRKIVDSARKMNIKVIALGVEEYTELKTVVDLGADLVQGFYIKEPSYTLTEIQPRMRETIKGLYQRTV